MPKIFDHWTPEDYQILMRPPQVRRYAPRLSHLKMVRLGDQPDAKLMRLWSLIRAEFGHEVYTVNRDQVVLAEAEAAPGQWLT